MPAEDPVLVYACHVADAEHAVPGPDVRIMKTGDGGFVIACDCTEERLDDADEPPHPVAENAHLVNVYADDPSPSQWLVLEDAADGWYDATMWDAAPEGFDGTLGKRRQELRDAIEQVADDNDRNSRGGADDLDRRARDVACPECGASVGVKCQRPSGHRVRKSHVARKDVVEQPDGEQGRLEVWT